MKSKQNSKTPHEKMYNYPNKIFDENFCKKGQNLSQLQITLAALLAVGIPLGLAKRVYLQLEQIVQKSPQLNRYDILLKMAQQLAVIL